MNQKQFRLIGVCLVLVLMVVGCAGPAPAPVQSEPSAPDASQAPALPKVTPNTFGPDDPHIFFLEPVDGDGVTASLSVRFGVTRVDLKNKRVFLTIDRACAAAGETLTADAQHLAFAQNRFGLSVDLSTGPHRLCLQVTDSKGVALDGPGMSQAIDITVE